MASVRTTLGTAGTTPSPKLAWAASSTQLGDRGGSRTLARNRGRCPGRGCAPGRSRSLHGAEVAPGRSRRDAGRNADRVDQRERTSSRPVLVGPLREGTATRRATVLAPGRRALELPQPPARSPSMTSVGFPTRHRPGVRVAGGARPAVIRAGLVSVLATRVGGNLPGPPDRLHRIATPNRSRQAWARPPPSSTRCPSGRKRCAPGCAPAGSATSSSRSADQRRPRGAAPALRLAGDGPTATLVLTRTDAGPLALLVERRSARSGAQLEEPRGLRDEEPTEQPGPPR